MSVAAPAAGPAPAERAPEQGVSDYVTYLEQLPVWRHPDVPFSVQGASMAGCATGFIVPEWRLCLDAGYPSRAEPAGLVLTHTHTDHTRALMAQLMNRRHTFNVFCPTAALEPLRQYLAACTNMRACSTRVRWNSSLYKGKLVPVGVGGRYQPVAKYYKDLDTPSRSKAGEEAADDGPPEGKRVRRAKGERRRPSPPPQDTHPGLPAIVHDLYVRATPALRHTVPSQGYVVAQRRHRLPAKLRGLDAVALRQLPAEEKREHFMRPLLAFVCDGDTPSTVAALDALRADPEGPPLVVLVECTFINDAEAEEATRRRHVLYSRLRPALERLVGGEQACHVLLVHLSRRYDRETLTRFAATLPPDVHLFA